MLRGNQLSAALEENSLDSWDFCLEGKEKMKYNYGREKRLL